MLTRRDRLEMARRVDFSFEVFVLGRDKAGSTEVCEKFVGRPIGSGFFDWRKYGKTIAVNETNIDLKIWCERDLTSLSDLVMLYRGLLLVYDVTNNETFEGLEELYLKQQKHNPSLATMLVGNNCHMEDRRVVSKERGAKFAAKHGFQFLEISAAKNINVHEAFYTLARQLKKGAEEKLENIRHHVASTASQWVVKRPKKDPLTASSLWREEEEQQLKESGWKINELPDKVIYQLGFHLNRPFRHVWKKLAEMIGFSAVFLQHLERFPDGAAERLLIQWGKSEPDATVFELYTMLRGFTNGRKAATVLLRTAMQSTPAPPEIRVRGHLAVEAYRNALRGGSTSVRRVPIMLIGQERSGKTSLKKSLMGKIFNPSEDSTVGIDKDPAYFQVTTEIWNPRKRDEALNSETALSFEYRAAQLIVSNLTKEEKESQPSRSTALSSVDSNETRNVNQSDPPLSLEVPSSSSEAPNDIAVTPADDAPSADIERHVPEEIAALVEKLLVEAKEEEKEEEKIFSVLWDFGGQSVYYVTHPLFLTPRAMYFLVYDLSQNPHDKANPLVKQGMFSTLEDSFHLKTNLDYLDFWMTSVASLARPDEDLPARANPKSEVLPENLPPVFLVCTHADQPYGGKYARTLARKVYGFLLSKPYKTHLYDDVFVVDNTKSGLESECLEVVRLREEVLAVAKDLPEMKEVIPVKWLKYEKALQQTKKDGLKFVSLDRAKEIAITECQIVDDQEFATLIDFLHDQKILLHFDDTPVLNNLVVLDLQWLIDIFKKVITITPYDSKEREFEGLWRKLEREGILEDTLLQHVWGPLLDQQQTSESLIAVMEKFSLLCRWPSSDASDRKEYLVPSMLMSHPPQNVISLVASAQIPSLLLKFESGQVPPGLFPRLILQFFQWGKDEVWGTVNPQLYQNFARFYTSGDNDCSVILRCHSSSIEVVVHRGNLSVNVVEGTQSKLTIPGDVHHEAFETACARAVHRQLGLMLQFMRKEFFWMKNMRYKIGVICPVCCQGGVVEYCRTHHQQHCEREECLHFWSEAELRSAKMYITCTKSATAKNNKIQVKQFAAWFPSQGEQASQQAVGECVKRRLPSDEGDENTSLAIPHEVVESLLSQSCDAKEVVIQLKENLQLDHAALQQPEPGTKRLIRYLASKAKQSNRLDVVKHLRDITPAGTTGPLLPGNLDIRNVPVRQMRELTIDLSSGDEWKEVAEKLGLSPKEIRYLDRRTLNPCDAALAFISQLRHIDVDDLYDVLNECELPLLADTL